MSMWGDLIESFKGGNHSVGRHNQTGGIHAIASHTQAIVFQPSAGRIERLCRELGWRWEKRGTDAYTIHFRGPQSHHREIRIEDGDACMVVMTAHSDAVMRNASPDILAYLLLKNFKGSGVGMWAMNVDPLKNIWFYLSYLAIGDGLTAASFKFICQSLLDEVDDFDNKMRGSGFLR